MVFSIHLNFRRPFQNMESLQELCAGYIEQHTVDLSELNAAFMFIPINICEKILRRQSRLDRTSKVVFIWRCNANTE